MPLLEQELNKVTTTPLEADLLTVLHDVFGFDSFRPYQEDIVRAIVEGRDAFVVMPTGGGKSLCYQLPAHVVPGLCVVISPLISLMKDQVDAAKENGLRADFMNSAQTLAERTRVAQAVSAGGLDLLYVSPERFAMEEFKQQLAQIPLAFVAIDEAHCISEWGHDFRPDYLALSDIVQRYPDTPVAAFTATATMKVQQDIISKLGLRNPHRVRASFNRPNLYYQVQPKHNPEEQVWRFIQSHPNAQGIIYRTTRKDVEATAAFLRQRGVKALPYHAGMEDTDRVANQEAFNRDEINVIVATIAFGMGIDKSNVRFVIHMDLPKNIEGYYQETGRAGRDGEPSHCLLLFSRGDAARIRYFIDQIEDPEARAHALRCLQDMVRYGGTHQCRRHQLLSYFNENYPENNCQLCDVCIGQVETTDATRDAQVLLSAMARTGERFGLQHVIDVVVGAKTKKIRSLNHHQIKTYGIGHAQPKNHWRSVADHLVAQGVVELTTGAYPVGRIAERGRKVLTGDARVTMLRVVETKTERTRTATPPCNEALFEALRVLRKQCADEQGVPPFVIFSDRSLREMAARMPSQPAELESIHGIGTRKREQYGDRFCAAIADFTG